MRQPGSGISPLPQDRGGGTDLGGGEPGASQGCHRLARVGEVQIYTAAHEPGQQQPEAAHVRAFCSPARCRSDR